LTLVDGKSEMQEFNIDVIGEILNSTQKKKNPSLRVWILCLHFNHAYSKMSNYLSLKLGVDSGNVTLSEKKFKKISHFFHSKMGKFWIFVCFLLV
jgi:hypothetical protein